MVVKSNFKQKIVFIIVFPEIRYPFLKIFKSFWVKFNALLATVLSLTVAQKQETTKTINNIFLLDRGNLKDIVNRQRWSRGHKARGQGQGHKKNPRPRTAFSRTDTLEAKDRNARGQGPRTQPQVFSEKKRL